MRRRAILLSSLFTILSIGCAETQTQTSAHPYGSLGQPTCQPGDDGQEQPCQEAEAQGAAQQVAQGPSDEGMSNALLFATIMNSLASASSPQPSPAPQMYSAPASAYQQSVSHSQFSAPRRDTNCPMNKMMCTRSCDSAPSFGLAKDYDKINMCRSDCERRYSC